MDDRYLWDRTGPADPEVERLEDLLGRFRRESLAPLRMPAPRPIPKSAATRALAAAAAVLVAAAGILWFVRSGAARPWRVERVSGQPRVEATPVSDSVVSLRVCADRGRTGFERPPRQVRAGRATPGPRSGNDLGQDLGAAAALPRRDPVGAGRGPGLRLYARGRFGGDGSSEGRDRVGQLRAGRPRVDRSRRRGLRDPRPTGARHPLLRGLPERASAGPGGL